MRVVRSHAESSGAVQSYSHPQLFGVVRISSELESSRLLQLRITPPTAETGNSDFAGVGIGLTIAAVGPESWVRTKEHTTSRNIH